MVPQRRWVLIGTDGAREVGARPLSYVAAPATLSARLRCSHLWQKPACGAGIGGRGMGECAPGCLRSCRAWRARSSVERPREMPPATRRPAAPGIAAEVAGQPRPWREDRPDPGRLRPPPSASGPLPQRPAPVSPPPPGSDSQTRQPPAHSAPPLHPAPPLGHTHAPTPRPRHILASLTRPPGQNSRPLAFTERLGGALQVGEADMSGATVCPAPFNSLRVMAPL